MAIERRIDVPAGKAVWLCRCDCGATASVIASKLTSGWTKSCGCFKYHSRNVIHGNSNHPLFERWLSMIGRCTNKRCNAYRYYGARGISVCERWMDFETFVSDMGLPPTPQHTIERKNNNGNYEPDNCKWLPKGKQPNNTRRTRLFTFNGRTMNIAQWCVELGLNPARVHYRLKRGCSAEIAFATSGRIHRLG